MRVVHWTRLRHLADILERGVPGVHALNTYGESIWGAWCVPAGVGLDARWAWLPLAHDLREGAENKEGLTVCVIADIPSERLMFVENGSIVDSSNNVDPVLLVGRCSNQDAGLVSAVGIPRDVIHSVEVWQETPLADGDYHPMALKKMAKEQYQALTRELGAPPEMYAFDVYYKGTITQFALIDLNPYGNMMPLHPKYRLVEIFD
jgi:hypothetical protein